MVAQEKQMKLDEIKKMVGDAKAIYFADCSKIKAIDITGLRQKMSNMGVKVKVVKNRITKKALNAIIELCPGSVIYVSCNPQTLFGDLQKFVKYYRISSVQPVDMFPHTPHIEIIVKLVQK